MKNTFATLLKKHLKNRNLEPAELIEPVSFGYRFQVELILRAVIST